MSLIARYIFREALVSTILVMLVLLVIFMSNQFAETLGDAAGNELPQSAVFTVLGLQFLQTLALLTPVGVLIGILLALARLSRDSEMAALAACGVGPARLLRPIGLMCVLISVGIGWLALLEAPEASRAIEEIRFRAGERTELSAILPERFTVIDSAGTVLWAREVDGDRMIDVNILGESVDGIEVLVAEEGEAIVDESGSSLDLVLHRGFQSLGRPGNPEFQFAEFEVLGMPIELEREEVETSIESTPTSTLLNASDPASQAELQWRIAAPLSILILGLLAIPLGRSSPREGKYARVGLGLLIYLIYANTLSIARVWVERETVPVALGNWWVHGLLAALALLMLAQQSGILSGGSRRADRRDEPAV